MTNRLKDIIDESFNPCFNGSMYKNDFGLNYGDKTEAFQSLF